ncbi:efflux RND transporter periplasmic adaptor subunit [Chachezhania sediminis]|uniref:efflux RND transporter periplasmic adaptor subunit n=1 Tax=Chachezhania sediminis TaxID=2599291 RepID=UPI00131E8AEC|nr:HlyD family efflux transporter periplasmic adaptor subunit [Chachezhania sediminis]
MRFLRRGLGGLFLLAVTLALLAFAVDRVRDAVETQMNAEYKAPPARERVFAVDLMTAELETVSPQMPAFGQIQSRRTLELRAPTSGRVLWLSRQFVEGGEVSEGEVLVQLDPTDAQSVLDRTRTERMDAEAEVRDADRALVIARDAVKASQDQADLRVRAFQRQQDLRARNVGTAAQAEEAELTAAAARQAVLSSRQAEATAEARVDQAATRLQRARIAEAEAQRVLDDTTIRAEFDGTLSEVQLVEGRLQSANEKLADLVDPQALEVAFRISTGQYIRLLNDEGRLLSVPVTVSLDTAGDDLRASGHVIRDSAAAGDGQTGRLLFAHLNDPRGFKPGDFVSVMVEEPPVDNVVRLPATALGIDGSVLVADDQMRLEAVPVTLVRRQGDDILVTGAGLDGRQVVKGRTPLLGAGIKVRPLRPTADAAPESAAAAAKATNAAALAPTETGSEAGRAGVPQTVAATAAAAVATGASGGTIALTDDRRARLIDFVEQSNGMPAEMKAVVLAQLSRDQVPSQLVERIEARMGG